MAKSSPDELMERIRLGQQAREGLAHVEPLLRGRLQQVVNEAVSAFRGGALTETRAVAYVAALSEVMALIEELEARVRAGERASQQVYGEAPGLP